MVTKIFAKVLPLCLAQKLNSLISTSQNAFIPERSPHDNFILVRESAQLLHQLSTPRVLLILDLARAFDSVKCHSCSMPFANTASAPGF